ncbi:T9SS type A sorting domain-containing protein [Polaribacter butkevichii]
MFKYLKKTKIFGGIFRFNVFNPANCALLNFKTASTIKLNKAHYLIISTLFLLAFQNVSGQNHPIFPNTQILKQGLDKQPGAIYLIEDVQIAANGSDINVDALLKIISFTGTPVISNIDQTQFVEDRFEPIITYDTPGEAVHWQIEFIIAGSADSNLNDAITFPLESYTLEVIDLDAGEWVEVSPNSYELAATTIITASPGTINSTRFNSETNTTDESVSIANTRSIVKLNFENVGILDFALGRNNNVPSTLRNISVGFLGEVVFSNPTVVVVNSPPVVVNSLNNTIIANNTFSKNVLTGSSDPDGDLDKNTVTLTDPNNPSNQGSNGNPLVIPGVGEYKVNNVGIVTFTPITDYIGDASVLFRVKDAYGASSNNGTLELTVLLDSDKDGVPDITDLDDDNDGILDTDEGYSRTPGKPACDGETILNFNNTYIEESGDGNSATFLQGEVFRFPNVADGIDALVTIVGFKNITTLPKLDDNSAGNNNAFQPQSSFSIANIGDQAWTEYKFDFVITNTTTPTIVNKFFVNFNDVDGNGNYGEQNWSQIPVDYVVNNPTELTITQPTSWIVGTAGYNEYPSVTNNFPQVNYSTEHGASSSYIIRLGAVARKNGVIATGRQHQVEFKCISNFINPDSITILDSDGDGIPNHLDLDSDNDGITDVVESGGKDNNKDGIADGNVGNTTTTLGIPSSANTGNTPANTDGDRFPDFIDIDADNDGIPDNIEAQTTTNYIAPSGIGSNMDDTNHNGIDDVYENNNTGLTPVDTDNDDSPDYLDSDADNDGIADIIENGDADNEIVDINADKDNDGLNDVFDDNDDSGTTGATVNDGSSSQQKVTNSSEIDTAFGDEDNNFPGTGDVDYRDLKDNDKDGIADYYDLDDDNDGILDTDEGCGNLIINGDFEGQDFASTTEFPNSDTNPSGTFIGTNFNTNTLKGWNYTQNLDGWVGGESPTWSTSTFADAYSGKQYLDVLGNNDKTGGVSNILSQTIATIPGTTYTLSFYWGEDIGHITGETVTLNLNVKDNTNPNIVNKTLTATAEGNVNGIIGAKKWYRFSTVFVASDTQTTISFKATPPTDGSLGAGAALDLVSVFANNCADTDGDGIPNAFDLDSDNDGIPDLVEAGGVDTDGNGKVDAIKADGTLVKDTNGNGLDDRYDVDNGGTAIENPDTDGDGIPNTQDLDADNDGIPDVIEAGGTDANGNGIADNFVDTDNDGFNDVVDGDVGQDGTSENTANALVVTGSDTDNDGKPNSYPNGDTDKDGLPNYVDLDADNDGIPDVIEAGGVDSNGDGKADGFIDADNDGFNDVVDGDPTNSLAIADDSLVANTNPLLVTGIDNDNNGTPDTIPTGDTDGDGIRDFLDLDADNDGIPDVIEAGGTDANGDGFADNFVDADKDGFNDVVDGDPTNSLAIADDSLVANTNPLLVTATDKDPANSSDVADGKPYTITTGDTDGDGIRDYLDLDSDNDGITDVLEAGGTDSDKDGKQDTTTDADKDGFDDAVDGDTNNDGTSNNIANVLVLTGTDSDTTDTTLDGKPNSYVKGDADTDGKPNFLDIDADNDGIPDNIEAQTTSGYIAPTGTTIADTNNNGVDDVYENLSTGEITIIPANTDISNDAIPDYLDTDSDNDGILDIAENGHTANVVSGTDSDNDGLDDAFDDNNDATIAGATVNDGLNSNNKVTDLTSLENSFGDEDNDFNPGTGDLDYRDIKDNDQDGIADNIDLDDDNDGIPDTIENGGNNAEGDEDGDGIPNYLDTTDNNGTGDGSTTDYTDSDNNGIPDVYDTDGDGIPNHFDLDSDNDGIPDLVEAGGVDTDGNGKIDAIKADGTLVNDVDNDGLDDRYDTDVTGGPNGNAIANPDSDGDGIPNTQDLDADNDGIPDVVEAGGTDANGDGLADGFVDTDNDGLNDLVDGDVAGTSNDQDNALILTGADTNNDGKPDSYVNGDTDNDGIPNFVDLDSDNDGIADIVEAGGVDTNGDGVVDYPISGDPTSMVDLDNDGLDDNYDTTGSTPSFTAGTPIANPDTDGDGIKDVLDLDSDNDGIPDVIEAGGTDTNGDGLADGFVDADNDGFNDLVDGDVTGTSNNQNNALVLTGTDTNNDGQPNSYTTGDTDGDGIPNHLDLDSDNDGITDIIEAGGTDTNKDGKVDAIATNGTLTTDINNDGFDDNVQNAPLVTTGSDTDNDGKPNSYTDGDADSDGIPNFLDIDADNDGIPDNIEAQTTSGYIAPSGVATGITDANNNGVDDVYEVSGIGFVPENTDNTDLPDYLDTDSDNDGILDIAENGHTANVVSGTDSDNDGLDDAFDDNNDATIAGATVNDGLNSNNKVTDLTSLENSFGDEDNDFDPASPSTGNLDYRDIQDNDNDGIADNIDLDNDNDGIPDTIENGGNNAEGDEDGDGIPNYLDTTDNNGTGDGSTTDYTDSDNNGIPDVYDTDGDGIPNHFDLDSDNDGIPDIVEAGGVDTNGDGKVDDINADGTLVNDVDNDGLDDRYDTDVTGGTNGNAIANPDSDGDGIPNAQDLDADNDGIPDVVEAGGTDANGDGLADGFVDADNDGLNDLVDGDVAGTSNDQDNALILTGADTNNDGKPDSYVNGDTDNDGIPNFVDLDSDNDGIADIVEAGGVDTNGDGVVDYPISGDPTSMVDLDNDGLDDNYDTTDTSGSTPSFTAGTPIANPDTDGDGIKDVLDLDSDNDGIPDVIEAGGTDTNGDGLADGFVDTDNDGFNDLVDGDVTGTSNNQNNALVLTGTDTNNDGQPNSYTTGDTDGDGIPNHLDLDSDNDGITDIIEAGGTDTNKDGKVDAIATNGTLTNDTNNDGFDDNVQNAPLVTTGPDTDNDGKPNSYTDGDADSDGIPNFLDIDADNDGIPDNIEAQTTSGYIAPSGVATGITDANNNGVDDVYEVSGIGFVPENTDNTDLPDYLDTDSDNDGILDIAENGHTANVVSGTDSDNDGLDDAFDDNNDATIAGATVNDGLNSNNKVTDLTSLENSFGDEDNDFNPGTGDLDYRDAPEAAEAMITQVYQFGTDKWIEITNIGNATIPANTIKVQLYKDKTGDQTGVNPDVSYTIGTLLEAGNSVLFKNSSNSIITSAEIASDATIITNNDLTNLDDATNDIITLSAANGVYSWENRYDVVSNVTNNTSVVRIDETIAPNATYTEGEWVVFINDAITTYQSGYGLDDTSAKRHPQDPLISEIKNSDSEANTLLGLHRIRKTVRENGNWSNGFPDRSRYVVIHQYYNHESSRFSARKLEVNAGKELRVTDNLLVVTNSIVLDGEIRLTGATAQLVQTHTDESTVSGNGQLFVDQKSEVPSLYRYNYMSSPVTTPGADTYSLATVLKDGTTPNDPKEITFVTGYDGSVNATGISLADYWIYTYAAGNNGRSNWEHKYRRGTINKGDGYIFKGPGQEQNYTFAGTPNDGSFTTENEISEGQSYLVGNPFPSAMNARKFLDDNSAITGTLYFWQHVGENDDSGTAGHNFGGYVGGYATQNKDMATAANYGKGEAVNSTLEAENGSEVTGIVLPLGLGTGEFEVSLNLNDQITFSNVPNSVDSLRVLYRANGLKKLNIKINNVDRGQLTFPNTENASDLLFKEIKFAMCIEAGSSITLTSSTNSPNPIFIDKIILKDEDGQTACTPDTGGDEYANAYKTPEPYIAVGQGFFVLGSNTKGKIVFNNTQRAYITKESGESVFFRSGKKTSAKTTSTALPILKLGMNYATSVGSSFHRQIGISFKQGNSFAYETGSDSQMYGVNSTDFYWKFPNDDTKYVIAGVQEISNALEVPLEIVVSKNSVITINIDEINNINQKVFIKDKLTGTTQQINNASATYQLKEGTYTDRFVLAFVDANTTLGLENDILAKQTTIFADNKNHNIVISKNQEININKVELFDILGKKVTLWTIKEQKEVYQLEIKNQIPTGIYIVKVNTNKGTMNKKIVIE